MTRPLVLLHGFTGAPASWEAVVERRGTAAGSPAAFAPPLLGHDGTPGPPDVGGWDDELDRLAGLVRARFDGPVTLSGYSLGGRVALGLLARHPELFAAAALIGANPGPAGPAERGARREMDEVWARLLERDGLPTFVAAWEALPLFRTQRLLDRDVLERQRRIRLAHDPAGLVRALRALGLGAMPDYRPALERIAMPVRIVAGEADQKFRVLAGEMAERLPRARTTIVAGAGHNVVLERPAEIARLLQELDG